MQRSPMAFRVTVSSHRGAGYGAEVSLQTEQGPLRCAVAARGCDAEKRRIDECKTFRRVQSHAKQSTLNASNFCRCMSMSPGSCDRTVEARIWTVTETLFFARSAHKISDTLASSVPPALNPFEGLTYPSSGG